MHANRSTDVRSGFDRRTRRHRGGTRLRCRDERWFPWTQNYERDRMAGPAPLTQRPHRARPTCRVRLLDAIGATIDDYGGSFVMNFETVLITATRLA